MSQPGSKRVSRSSRHVASTRNSRSLAHLDWTGAQLSVRQHTSQACRCRCGWPVTTTHPAKVFSAGGESFTWDDVIDSARARGDWAPLQRRLLRLLTREEELAAAGSLPDAAEVRCAASEFRYRLGLL